MLERKPYGKELRWLAKVNHVIFFDAYLIHILIHSNKAKNENRKVSLKPKNEGVVGKPGKWYTF